MIYEISGQTIDVIAIILTIITANVMLDWKLSERRTLGEYLKYRKLPKYFTIVLIAISILTTFFIATALISHMGLLGAILDGWFSVFGYNIQFKIT
jgi:hypothetical protein